MMQVFLTVVHDVSLEVHIIVLSKYWWDQYSNRISLSTYLNSSELNKAGHIQLKINIEPNNKCKVENINSMAFFFTRLLYPIPP